ncbi:MAG: MerR family transcriptional regulator [Anaerolineae bacterium]|nr:MerR family transcriptional regulator [Anaerolineae bacterium]
MAMFIQELSRRTGVSTKAIRYYESIGLLAPPQRAANNYRVYTAEAVEKLRFIAAARTLDFSLTDIADFIEARNKNQLPCRRVVDSLDRRIADIDRRIADLVALRETIVTVQQQARHLAPDQPCDEQCVCDLLSNRDGRRQTNDERT